MSDSIRKEGVLVSTAEFSRIFSEHDFVLRVVSLVECEVDKYFKGRNANFVLLELAFDYLAVKSSDDNYLKMEALLLGIREKHLEYAGLVDELLIDHRELIKLEQEILQEFHCGVISSSEKRYIFERMQELCWRKRHYFTIEERDILSKFVQYTPFASAFVFVDDPLFGEERLEKFEPLYTAYLDSARRVSIGNVPYALLELAPAISERVVYTGMELTRLPKRLFDTSRHQLRRQRRIVRRLSKARNFSDVATEIQNLKSAVAAIPREILIELSEVLQAIEPAELASDDTIQGIQSNLPAVANTISFRRRRPRRAAGISWQAASLNLFLRGTIKQLMGFIGTDYADQAKSYTERWDKPPSGSKVTPVEGLGFPADWVVLDDAVTSDRVVMHLPGGGFFFPAIWAHKEILAQLIGYCGAEGLLVHYRLAPENPFPASLEDALKAYKYLLDKGVDPKKIVIVGDSAGGGLTLSLLLALKDAHLPQPAAVGLLSPMSDLSFTGPSRSTNRWLDPMLPTRRKMRGFELYTGEADPQNPYLSPIFGDFSDCAPMFAQVGSTEILLDDTLRIAAKARQCGVDFELEVWEGMPHVWHLWSVLPETDMALKHAGIHLNEKLDRYS